MTETSSSVDAEIDDHTSPIVEIDEPFFLSSRVGSEAVIVLEASTRISIEFQYTLLKMRRLA